MNKEAKKTLCKCGTTNYSWVHDPDLCIWEKIFHVIVFVIGLVILIFAIRSLKVIVFDVLLNPIGQGAGTVAVSILMFLLVLFGVSCISGRGMAFVDAVLDFTKKATSLEIPWVKIQREKQQKES